MSAAPILVLLGLVAACVIYMAVHVVAPVEATSCTDVTIQADLDADGIAHLGSVTCTISDPIIVDDEMVLTGEGRGRTIFIADESDATISVGDGAYVAGIEFDGDDTAATLVTVDGQWAVVERMYLHSCTAVGFIHNSPRNVFASSVVDGCATGWSVQNSATSWATRDVWVRNATEYAANINSGEGGVASGGRYHCDSPCEVAIRVNDNVATIIAPTFGGDADIGIELTANGEQAWVIAPSGNSVECWVDIDSSVDRGGVLRTGTNATGMATCDPTDLPWGVD